MSKPISSIRAKYQNNGIGERPFFIDERSWGMFVAHVRDGKSFRDIGVVVGLSPYRVSQIVARVDYDLETPRPAGPNARALTIDSPVGDLMLSMRARNALGELGCRTVRDLLEHDFTRGVRRLGPVTRAEIVSTLAEHGFAAPPGLHEPDEAGIAELSRHVARLRERIEMSLSQWSEQVRTLEEKIRKLTGRESERNGREPNGA
jgi:hypothetical protein